MNAVASPVLPQRLRRTSRDRTLVTPEGIALPIVLASRGTRFGALLLDLTFIGMLILFTTFALAYIAGGVVNLLGELKQAGPVAHAIEFLIIVWFALMFLLRNAYFLFFELGPRGATPGKRITGIRIAARDGSRLTAEMVIARNLLRDIELFLPLVFLMSASDGGDMGAAGLAATAWFLIFALFPFFNKDRLRAGDIIAGTWVLEAPKARLEAAMSTVRPLAGPEGQVAAAEPKYRFGEAELAVYGEYELQTLERVLRDNRPEALRPVYEAICRKIGWTAGGGDERAFLEAYYTQLRARLESGMRLGKRKADKFAGGRLMAEFRIVEDDLLGEAIAALLRLHLDELHRLSPPESVHAMPIERLREADVTFYSAWHGEQLAACGALKQLEPGHGEIKSMRAAPAWRGKGAGKAILRHLLAEAAARGYERVSLETGASDEFVPARTMYRAHGFVDCGPFGDYRDDPLSVFMARRP